MQLESPTSKFNESVSRAAAKAESARERYQETLYANVRRYSEDPNEARVAAILEVARQLRMEDADVAALVAVADSFHRLRQLADDGSIVAEWRSAADALLDFVADEAGALARLGQKAELSFRCHGFTPFPEVGNLAKAEDALRQGNRAKRAALKMACDTATSRLRRHLQAKVELDELVKAHRWLKS